MVTSASVKRLVSGWAGVIALGCARHPGPPPAPGAPREIRIAHDYGLGGPGPLLVVSVRAGGLVHGAVFVRTPRPISGLPDSLAALLRTQREAMFARVGCREPVEMGRALACPAQFREPGPNWGAALRLIEPTLVADSAAERAETLARRPAVQPDGTIRIRGCNDCGGVDAEVREASGVRGWRLSPEAATRLGRLVDSLVARAGSGSP
jgi:hypothetical protein